jgi:ankyrin repeat protein
LHQASQGGSLEVARLLVEHGADVHCQDKFGWTPLHVASKFRHLDVTLLLHEQGADINPKTQSIWTPLHVASSCSHLEIVKLLLEWGGNVYVHSDEGQMASQLASSSGLQAWEIVQLLMEYGTY